ncbi:Hexokinase type 2, partial [Gryllus bimaculatus]
MVTYLYKPTPQLIEVCNRFDLKEDTLVRIRDVFTQELLRGLEENPDQPSSLACKITYVQDVPSGEESGTFLALDLGGADFRVIMVRLHKKRFDMKSKAYLIPKLMKSGPGSSAHPSCLIQGTVGATSCPHHSPAFVLYPREEAVILADLVKDLLIEDDVLKKMMDVYQSEIRLGLSADTVDQSSLKCYVTYVQDLPSGNERGKFLALDLGGTNFRVLLVSMTRRHFDMRARVYIIPKDIMTSSGAQLAEMCKILDLDNDTLKKMMEVYESEIGLGLSADTVDQSSLKCYVTYVQDIPKGDEKGQFLALDLGGTNFRVLVIKLARTYFDMRAKVFAVPQSIMTGPGSELFDHIAECLFAFTSEHKINKDNLPLGFTFSFPCEQKGLSVGILKQWTKGFSCSGVEGENVVALLEEAISRKKDLLIDVVAFLNDTTGTLMSCAWKKNNTRIGLIIGTGTNSCYVEKVENVSKFDGDKSKPYVIINTESGAFGGQGQIDCEKMISGMYLGEFVRRVLVTAVERQFIFGGVATEQLKTKDSFESKLVSEIETDLPGQHVAARNILNAMGYGSPSEQDCVDLHYVCYVAWQRAGRMVSATMAALLNHMNFPDVTIGVDGSLYRFHPGFSDLMNNKIRELTNPSIQ